MAYQLPNGAHISNDLDQMIWFAGAKVFLENFCPLLFSMSLQFIDDLW